MKRHTGGGATDSSASPGFSLVEILTTLAIVCGFIGIVSAAIPGFRKTLGKYLDQSMTEEAYLIFLVVFERDYNQAEVPTAQMRENLDDMLFRIDFNSDGDFLDPGERIQYRWNRKKNRIDRKSGKGSFQAFFGGVRSFSWQRAEKAPNCHRMTLKTLFSDNLKSLQFCRSDLQNR